MSALNGALKVRLLCKKHPMNKFIILMQFHALTGPNFNHSTLRICRKRPIPTEQKVPKSEHFLVTQIRDL